MLKFATIVLVVYGAYYALAIAYQIFRSGPTASVEKKRDLYSVEGADNDIHIEESATIVDDDIQFSPEATAALKKKGK